MGLNVNNMKTIKEKNRMILDFMQVKPGYNSFTKQWQWNDGIFFSVSKETEEEVMDAISEYAKYNKHWHWIMLAVEEIGLRRFTDKNFMGDVVMFGTNRTAIKCYKVEGLMQTIDESDVAGPRATFEAVVKYIEWYNQSK